MSGSFERYESGSRWRALSAKPQAGLEWHAWVEAGHVRDLRKSAARVKAVKWVSIAVLLATAAFWSYVTPYGVVVRFVVAGAALVVMSQALHANHYAAGAVFGALALLYNPVAPTFPFTGDWQRAVVVASAVPFMASLVWRVAGKEQNA